MIRLIRISFALIVISMSLISCDDVNPRMDVELTIQNKVGTHLINANIFLPSVMTSKDSTSFIANECTANNSYLTNTITFPEGVSSSTAIPLLGYYSYERSREDSSDRLDTVTITLSNLAVPYMGEYTPSRMTLLLGPKGAAFE